jgi:threonine/homoserine/homoserine lactone efflux protein
MISLIAGIFTGIIVAIPPGPMSVIILKQTLNHGLRRGLVIGMGTTTLDFFYCLAFLIAAGSVFGKVSTMLDEYSTAFIIFQLLCAIGLVAYGIYSLRPRASQGKAQQADTATEAITEAIALPASFTTHGPFLLGLGLSLTQIANPTFVPLMTSISLLAHDKGFVHPSVLEYTIFAGGYAIGIFAWLYLIMRLSVRYRDVLSERFLLVLNRFVGLSLITFGTYLGYRLTTVIRWADIMRFLQIR